MNQASLPVPPFKRARNGSLPALGSVQHVSMEGLRPGLTEATVGLLPGMRTKYMEKYNTDVDKKGKRAPREDLTGLTAEERVERRKARARVYSHCARQRHKALLQEAQEDLDAMDIYRTIVETAPHIVMVLSADLRCTVLYANEAVSRLLCIPTKEVMGSSLWEIIHKQDQHALGNILTRMILTRTDPSIRVHVRLKTSFDDHHVGFHAGLRCGTQGIHCTLWPTKARKEAK